MKKTKKISFQEYYVPGMKVPKSFKQRILDLVRQEDEIRFAGVQNEIPKDLKYPARLNPKSKGIFAGLHTFIKSFRP